MFLGCLAGIKPVEFTSSLQETKDYTFRSTRDEVRLSYFISHRFGVSH